MMPSDQFEVGDEINGTYRVQEKLAEGGMGAIYKVEHRAFGLPYALKVSHFEGDEQGREAIWQRFKKEAQTLAHLHHKNIVSVFDFGRTKDGAPFYVMDYIVGQNLTQWIRKGGQIPWEKAFYIFIEIADGLAYAHAQGVVHRDIKPSNIMVAGVPGTPTLQVKIVDFGIACETLPEIARENDVNSAGSPPYMSPEQLYNRPIDSRSDIYSLGCTLFEVLTGVPPFVGDNALEIAMKHASVEPPSLKEATLGQNFPEAVETMITKLLQKDPQRRYQNIEIVAREMRALLDPSNKPEPPPGSVTSREPKLSPGVRHFDRQAVTSAPAPTQPMAKLFMALVAVAVVALAAVLLLLDREKSPKPTAVSQTNPPSRQPTGQPAGQPTGQLTGEPTQQTVREATTPAAPSDSSATIDSADYLNRKPFSTITKDQEGHALRVFEFPKNVSIGSIWDEAAHKQTQQVARGRVTFPAASILRFHASAICVDRPMLLRRFRADDLQGIDITNNERATSETLIYIDHLTNLTQLSIYETEMNDDCLKTISHFAKLENFDFSNTNLSGGAVAKLPQLMQLSELRMSGISEASILIKALTHSKKLWALHADTNRLSFADFQNLTKMPALTELSVDGTSLDMRDFAELSHCANLHFLSVASNGLKVEIATWIKRFRTLQKLEINCDGWTPEQIKYLRQINPDKHFDIDQLNEAPL